MTVYVTSYELYSVHNCFSIANGKHSHESAAKTTEIKINLGSILNNTQF